MPQGDPKRHTSRGLQADHTPTRVLSHSQTTEEESRAQLAPASSHHNDNTAPECVGRCAQPWATGTDPSGTLRPPDGPHTCARILTPPTAAAGAISTCAHTLPGGIENTDNPRKGPRAPTSRQEVEEPHAVMLLRAILLACRRRVLVARGPLPEKGTWAEG